MKKPTTRSSTALKKLFLITLVLLLLLPGCHPSADDGSTVTLYCMTKRQEVNGDSTKTATLKYNKNGILSERTEFSGGTLTETYHYDDQGNLLRYEGSKGTAVYTYNENGDVLTASGPNNDIRYTYDEQGNCISRSYLDPDGSVRETYQYTYDENGTLIGISVYNGSDTSPNSNTEWVYDSQGNLLEECSYLNGSLYYHYRYTYDKEGNLLTQEIEVSGQLQSSSTLTYDKAGNEILRIDRSYSNGQCSERTTTSTYDEAGNQLTWEQISSEGDSSAWVATYDNAGNQLTQTYTNSFSDPSYNEWTYDADGNMLTELWTTTGVERLTTYTYDKAGHMLSMTINSSGAYAGAPSTSIYTYTYDKAGNLICEELSAPYGEQTITYTYQAVTVPRQLAEEIQAQQTEIMEDFNPPLC